MSRPGAASTTRRGAGDDRQVARRELATSAAAEVAIVVVAGGVTVLLVRWALGLAAGWDGRSPSAAAIGPLWAAAMLVLAAAGGLVRRAAAPARARALVAGLAGVAAGLAMVPLMAGLNGTLQPPMTILHGDQIFRTEYVVRFAAGWQPQDYTLRGEWAFYPPLWFWLAGRTAWLLQSAPWEMLKPFTIATTGAALAAAYWLWRAVLSPATALAAAIGSLLALGAPELLGEGHTPAWYSPYSCFVAVCGPPWVAATLDAIGREGARGRLALLALAGTVLALTYYLLFATLAVALAVLALAPRAGRRAAAGRLGAVLGAVLALTAFVWIPLLEGILAGGGQQAQWLGPGTDAVVTGLSGPAGLTALALLAIPALALTWGTTGSRAVGAVLIAAVVHQLASLLLVLVAHAHLQPHRAVTLLCAAFGAAIPVAFEALRDPRSPAGGLERRLARPLAAALLVPAIGATFALGAAQGADHAAGDFTRAAYRPVDVAGAQEIARFVTGAAGRPAGELTLLTTRADVLLVAPFYGFLPLGAHFAHPSARQRERLAAVRAAAACRDPACADRALTRTPFGAIDALVLARSPGGYVVEAQEPAYPRLRDADVTFPAAALPGPGWERRDFGATTVLARTPTRR